MTAPIRSTPELTMSDEEIERVLGKPVPDVGMIAHQAVLETAALFVREGREAEVPPRILQQYKKIIA